MRCREHRSHGHAVGQLNLRQRLDSAIRTVLGGCTLGQTGKEVASLWSLTKDSQHTLVIGRLVDEFVEVERSINSSGRCKLRIGHLPAVKLEGLFPEAAKLGESLVVVLFTLWKFDRPKFAVLVADDLLQIHDQLIEEFVSVLVDLVLDADWLGGVVGLLFLEEGLLGRGGFWERPLEDRRSDVDARSRSVRKKE